jgi:LacI family transcriptional regulator
MRKSASILLSVPTDIEYGRGVIQGIIRFAATTNWILADAPFQKNGTVGLKEANRSGAECAGVIALIESDEQAQRFESLSVPCVSISSALNEPDLLTVACDDKMIGSLAASHFLERQMRHFGFVGLPDRNDSKVRFSGFADRLSVDGFSKISKHEVPEEIDSAAFSALGQWIESLPKPAGIFAMSDVLGRMVVDACRSASVRVPAAVSVLGCGNDPVICGLSSPALSSVALPAERVGFEAADLLATLISGKRPAERHRLIQVSSVIPRESTDNVSVRDPDVANALRFILAHAGEWIGVRELLLALPVQRRSLERKFRKVLGRSPLEEIRRVRVDLAKQLLSSTDLPMPIVARRSGFSEAKQLSQVFRALVGTTPTSYRSQFRLPDEAPKDPAEVLATQNDGGDE